MRTRTKLCGMMTASDALAAAHAGADAIGMILHANARRLITPDTASQIVRSLPPYITPVGVFVDAPTATVLELSDDLRLTTVQFHGNETSDNILAVAPLKVIKAIRVDPSTIRETLANWSDLYQANQCPNLIGILLETHSKAGIGGTGQINDFELIATLQKEAAFDHLPPVVVAGGLTDQNIAQVVNRLKPYAVDVSSGIESEFGKKSPEKMRAFVRACVASS